jgi:hypothetical protein
MPQPFYKAHNSDENVISADDYDFNNSTPLLSKKEGRRIFKHRLSSMMNSTTLMTSFTKLTAGQQIDPYTKFPYRPIALDQNQPSKRSQTVKQQNAATTYGVSSLSSLYTPTAMIGDMSTRALARLAAGDKPFCLTVSFNNPHPPMVSLGCWCCVWHPAFLFLFFSQR